MAIVFDTEFGSEMSIKLFKVNSSHIGWFGFDTIIKNTKINKTIILKFNEAECYIADKTQADDIGQLLEQFKSGKIDWANSDERDLQIKGTFNKNFVKLEIQIDQKNCEINVSKANLETFLNELNTEALNLSKTA